jgi:small subunit ribosomal protein S21
VKTMGAGAVECKPELKREDRVERFSPIDTNPFAATLTRRVGKRSRDERCFGPQLHRRGSEYQLTEIRLKKGESVDKALRRLKKKIDREGTLKEVRNHRHFEKPSERKRRKMKAARFSAMLTARYADL